MNDSKVLIELVVPLLDEEYDIYFPINRRIGNIIALLNKALHEETNGLYNGDENTMLYDGVTGDLYEVNSLVRNTNIRNGSRVILL